MPLTLPAAEAPAQGPRIIKAHAVASAGAAVAMNLEDLRRVCDGQLDAVRTTSRQLVERASADAAHVRRDAADAGRQAGYAAGWQAAEAEIAAQIERQTAEQVAAQVATLLPAVQEMALQLQEERERWVARWECEALRLALAVAEKLLRRTLAEEPSAAIPQMAQALRLASAAPELTVRLHPADHEHLDRAQLAAAAGRLGDITFVPDSTITPGGCLVETRHGQIDGRIETMLARIAEELTDEQRPAEQPSANQPSAKQPPGKQTASEQQSSVKTGL